eukprot:2880011-Rhodomonas_salina.1
MPLVQFVRVSALDFGLRHPKLRNPPRCSLNGGFLSLISESRARCSGGMTLRRKPHGVRSAP